MMDEFLKARDGIDAVRAEQGAAMLSVSLPMNLPSP
jgi:hypothetical protein